jgi:hypothetical protein
MSDLDIAGILKKAGDKCGFNRIRWLEKDMPTSIDNITIMVFFGDIRSMFILSSLLLKRYREEVKGSRYFILCTWPGYESLFPYVNEYWAIRDIGILTNCYEGTSSFENNSVSALQFRKNLNHWFNDVVGSEELEVYYKNGLKQPYWDRFKNIKRYLPSVASSALLGQQFNQELIKKPGSKVFIYPTELIQKWNYDKITYIKANKDFWNSLVKELLNNGITPIIFNGIGVKEMSLELMEKCIYVRDLSIEKAMAAMRVSGCVLDIFSGISRLAIAARTPYIYLDERIRSLGQKEFEIDGLCCEKGLPREYVYSFPNVIPEGNESVWKTNIYDVILARLFKFLPTLNRDNWPSPVESLESVLYENVKKNRMKKIGVKFIKVNRDVRRNNDVE